MRRGDVGVTRVAGDAGMQADAELSNSGFTCQSSPDRLYSPRMLMSVGVEISGSGFR